MQPPQLSECWQGDDTSPGDMEINWRSGEYVLPFVGQKWSSRAMGGPVRPTGCLVSPAILM